MYGSSHIVYGTHTCKECKAPHSAAYHIKESSRSRFRLLQFAAEMNAYEGSKGSTNRKIMEKAFETARNNKEWRDLKKDILQTQKDIAKSKSLAFNVPKLADRTIKFAAKDKELTKDLRDYKVSFEKRFPGVKTGFSPSSAASSQKEDTKFMLGILISGTDVLVTTSGSGLRTEPFIASAKLKGYEIAEEVKPTDLHPSLGGRLIPTSQYLAAKEGNGYDPGGCAAPRLVAKALANDKIRANHANWEMSEIYYFPNNDARRAHEDESDKARSEHAKLAHPDKGDPNCAICKQFDAQTVGSLYWVPGLTAHSCDTCENLVPLLMCPQKA